MDPLYSIALLHNNTIEIHSIHTQEIVQVIPLPSSSSPTALQPRSLFHSWTGLDLGAATGRNKVEVVSVPLLPPAVPAPAWPTTPTKKEGRGRTRSSSAAIGGVPAGSNKGKGTATKTLVVGKNSLFGLTPLTLVVQADALMEKGRVEDALALTEQQEKAGEGRVGAVRRLLFHLLRSPARLADARSRDRTPNCPTSTSAPPIFKLAPLSSKTPSPSSYARNAIRDSWCACFPI